MSKSAVDIAIDILGTKPGETYSLPMGTLEDLEYICTSDPLSIILLTLGGSSFRVHKNIAEMTIEFKRMK